MRKHFYPLILMDLQKGAVLDLKKADGSSISKVRVGLSWDVQDNLVADLDLFIVQKLTDGSKKVAYFNKRDAIEGVYLSEDNRTGEGDGDDEYSVLDATVTPDGEYFVCVNIYTSDVKFAQVANPEAKVYDDATGEVLATYRCGQGGVHNGLVVGKLTDAGDFYKFEAMGDYVNGNIEEISNSL